MHSVKHSILFIMLTMNVGIASAQQINSSGPWQFHSMNNVGLLEGETGSAFQIQTINGVKYKSWFAGIGLGMDFYRLRTIPLFADFRKEFGKSNNKIFVYSDIGINFSWVTDQQKTMNVENDKFHNGFYGDWGLGYKVKVNRKNNFLLSLGYSYKKTVETYDQIYYPPGIFYGPETQPNDQGQKINYSLNRLTIKIGWEF
ncbi:MAG TPA: hypothetical protein VK711_10935 [Puia sp.]|nr:hypothetical protein [Puia sp.]